jgi:ATP-dependent Lhr-like helicase
LAFDTQKALEQPLSAMGLDWTVALRTGDSSAYAKREQLKDVPDVLITTPESLSLLLSLRASARLFEGLEFIVADEWHELMGSKRGVLAELALARLRRLCPGAQTWGLSATLGNTEQAARVLMGAGGPDPTLVRGTTDKQIVIDSLLPETMREFPWAGHMGLKMLPRLMDELDAAESSLVFTNTRAQAEIWRQAICAQNPPWADRVALHHGSLDQEVRKLAEDGLKNGALKAVVCTSSLDLGVDFGPVDRVFQIGSPKGVARILQRAGRSGHRPGAPSRVTCLPTHAWELLDIAAVRRAAEAGRIEDRAEVTAPLDVLAQHLVTMALADGFRPEELLPEVRSAWSYRSLTERDWEWCLDFVSRGGESLRAYPEFRKVIVRDGIWRVEDKRIAQRHRMNIGVIVSEPAVSVRMGNGASLGTVEENFAAKLKPGQKFMFAGRALHMVRLKEMTLTVRPAKTAVGATPHWAGGRMPLSTELAATARETLEEVRQGELRGPELTLAAPIFRVQAKLSAIPGEGQLLVERIETKEGAHHFFFPIEGRLVHEGLAALFALRLARASPMTFSLSANDYGFELLTPQADFAPDESELRSLFSADRLAEDILESLNAAEMAKRQFREIARVAGLVFQGYPGQAKSARNVQASSGLLFDVFRKYDPGNPLLRQADEEVLSQRLEESRLAACLARLRASELLLTRPARPTPMSLPILADRLRQTVSTETPEDVLVRMMAALDEADT